MAAAALAALKFLAFGCTDHNTQLEQASTNIPRIRFKRYLALDPNSPEACDDKVLSQIHMPRHGFLLSPRKPPHLGFAIVQQL
jgi:hypothetical protein